MFIPTFDDAGLTVVVVAFIIFITLYVHTVHLFIWGKNDQCNVLKRYQFG